LCLQGLKLKIDIFSLASLLVLDKDNICIYLKSQDPAQGPTNTMVKSHCLFVGGPI